ncbi:hypothetical protein OIU79_001728 [Salix purpurea]|uniref:Uncharacterized protein n=1 Tax=Salix purpurea TaxID=77065 RepID=A0A9Q0ZHD1_SALPP|nr:hypothetical protein OIU79_001728 [Salix purpurea]
MTSREPIKYRNIVLCHHHDKSMRQRSISLSVTCYLQPTFTSSHLQTLNSQTKTRKNNKIKCLKQVSAMVGRATCLRHRAND